MYKQGVDSPPGDSPNAAQENQISALLDPKMKRKVWGHGMNMLSVSNPNSQRQVIAAASRTVLSPPSSDRVELNVLLNDGQQNRAPASPEFKLASAIQHRILFARGKLRTILPATQDVLFIHASHNHGAVGINSHYLEAWLESQNEPIVSAESPPK